MPEMLPVTVWTIAGSCLTGVLLALLASLKLAIARRPEGAATSARWLMFLLDVALVPLVVLGGVLIDVVGPRPAMIAGPVLLALSLLAMSAGPDFSKAIAVIVVGATAAATVAAAATVLTPRATFGESEVVASLLFGTALVALSAMLAAPLIDLSRRKIGFRGTMLALSAVCLAVAGVAMWPRNDQLALARMAEGIPDVLGRSELWRAALVLFFYAPLEGFVSVWVTRHLDHRGESPDRATHLLIGFWAAMLVSRLVLAIVLHEIADRYVGGHDLADRLLGFWAAVISTCLIAVVLGNLAAMPRMGQIRFGVIVLGAVMGPVYPLILGLVFRQCAVRLGDGVTVQAANSGTAYALLSAGASLGGVVLSPLIGYCARSRNVPVALVIPMFVAIAMAIATVVYSLE